MFDWLFLILLTLLGLSGWMANILGMPGNWGIVLLSAALWWLAPVESRSHVATAPLLAIGLVAVLGEILEFAASALGASRMGGSRRGTVLAMAGSIAGAIAAAADGG